MGVEVDACDTDPRAGLALYREYGSPTISEKQGCKWPFKVWGTYRGICEQYDGAIIATPNHLHYDAAREAIVDGRMSAVMIEKPLAHDLNDAEHILLHADTEEVPLLVGYCLRFHPGLRRTKGIIDSGAIGTVRHASIHFGSYLPDWRPGIDYRTNYAASRKTGGGILMDASHELDYACWLFGQPVSVSCTMQNSGALQIETEDIADLVVRFESGVQASIHLDYLDQEAQRGCRIVGDTGSIDWNFNAWVVKVSKKAGKHTYEHQGQAQPFHPDDMYRAELRHFLACIRGEEKPLVTGEDGLRAVQIVEAARKASDTGRVVNI